jgi:competence protein ComEA
MVKEKKYFLAAIVFLIITTFVPFVLAEDSIKINLNEASAEELIKIKGIGKSYAERIVNYREKNGPFKQVEDLMLVKGIGPKKIETIKDRLKIE